MSTPGREANMKWQECKNLANQIITIITDPSFERHPLDKASGYSFESTPEKQHALNTALDMLTTEFMGEVHEKNIKKHLYRLICHVYDTHGATDHVKTIATAIQTYIEARHAEPEFDWDFLAVLERATISEPWNLGNFSVVPGSAEQVQALKEKYFEIRALIFGIDEEEENVKTLERLFGGPFDSRFAPQERDRTVILIATVKAKDHLIGREKAIERFEEAVNFLRFCSMPIYGLGKLWALGLYGDVAKRNRSLIGMSLQGGITQQASAEIYPVDLDRVKLSGQDVYFALAAIPSENRSPFEKRVIQAIQWIGETVAAQDITHQYLFIFTALETLLLDETVRGAISQTLAERCAFLVGKNLKARKYIVR